MMKALFRERFPRARREIKLWLKARGAGHGAAYVRNRLRGLGSWRGILAARMAGLPRCDSHCVHLLCCHADVPMACWALPSFLLSTGLRFPMIVHDDGTLTAADEARLKSLLPDVTVRWRSSENDAAMAERLRAYPNAYECRNDSAGIWAIKLFDPLFTNPAPGIIILDTDVLWFRHTEEVAARVKTPGAAPLFWDNARPIIPVFTDGPMIESIGYINSGLIVFEPDQFDFAAVESYCIRLGREKRLILMDQPGYAYALAHNREFSLLPHARYCVRPPVTPEVVAKHYTGLRREELWWEGVPALLRSWQTN